MYVLIYLVVPICTYRYIIPIGMDAIGIGIRWGISTTNSTYQIPIGIDTPLIKYRPNWPYYNTYWNSNRCYFIGSIGFLLGFRFCLFVFIKRISKANPTGDTHPGGYTPQILSPLSPSWYLQPNNNT